MTRDAETIRQELAAFRAERDRLLRELAAFERREQTERGTKPKVIQNIRAEIERLETVIAAGDAELDGLSRR